jgi:small subunit ribosomal protein S17
MANTEKKETAQVETSAKVTRILAGEVVSDKMDKTVVVKVTRRFKHPLLGKTVQKSKKYKVHDEEEKAKIGDWVEITECRPLSKTKHMTLSRIVRKA